MAFHSNRTRRQIRICGLAALLALAASLAAGLLARPALAQSPSGIQLVESDARHAVVELTVPEFWLEAADNGGARVVIPGLVQSADPGAPQLPVAGISLAAPATEGLTLRILSAEFEPLPNFTPQPAPQPALAGDDPFAAPPRLLFNPDPAIFSADSFYPPVPAAIEQTALLRDQPVAALRLWPVQVNPTSGEARLVRRLRVEVLWPATVSAQAARPENPAVARWLANTLPNYRPPAQPATPAPQPIFAAAETSPALKISVTTDGLVRLTGSDLTAAGFDVTGLNPRTLGLSNRSRSIPVRISGEADGTFDPGDRLLFYGQAITSMYTTENIYWLSAGSSPGLRMAQRSGAPSGGPPTPADFPARLHAETDSYYWLSMPNGAGQDHWFWGGRLWPPNSRDYPLNLQNIATSTTTATLRLRLKGYSNSNHRTQILLNSAPVGDFLWQGQTAVTREISVPVSALVEGENTVTVQAVDTGAAVDQLLVNWIELDYRARFVAVSDRLAFAAPAAGPQTFEISGFSGPDVTVLDITDPAAPVEITGTAVISSGGGYSAQFEDATLGNSRYLAQVTSQAGAPAGMRVDAPSALKLAQNGADYIIIAPPEFVTRTQRLADFRRGQGLRVFTAATEDIYDEFNGGIFDPQAIRDFLTYTYQQWTPPAPAFVLLVGDATQDFHDNFNTGSVNFVPSQIVQTSLLGDTPSDNWFVQVSGNDVLPDMFVGRLSAQTAGQVDDLVDKIIRYEQSPPDGGWNAQALLVADDDDTAFETISEELAARLPADFSAARVFAADFPPGDPTTEIAAQINGGALLVNYAGHGSMNKWGYWDGNQQLIFGTADAAALTNGSRLPVVTAGDCLNGFFTGVQSVEALAESLHRPRNGGAVAVWASAAVDFPGGHRALLNGFYGALFNDGLWQIGAATTAAQVSALAQNPAWQEMVQTFILFGDPATRLAVPPATFPAANNVYLPLLKRSE